MSVEKKNLFEVIRDKAASSPSAERSVNIAKAILASVPFAGGFASLIVSEKVSDSMPKADIVDTAVAAGSFNSLVTAIKAAGLVDTLQGEGPFTVFAPTDDAFLKLPAGTVESLTEPGNKDKLAAILTYHVVAVKVTSGDLAGKQLDSPTANGQSIAIDGSNGVMVNDASVTSADVEASNGVIHVIDTVLLPK